MTYQVLLASLVAQLRKSNLFPKQKMYIEAQKQGLQRPSFFVEQVHLAQQKQMFDRYRRTYTLLLTWLPELSSQTQDADCRQVGEQLLDLLRLIDMPDRPVRPTDMEFEVATGKATKELHLSMQVVIHVYSAEDHVLMQHLDLSVFEKDTQVEL